MRPYATSVCGLKPLAYLAGLKLLAYLAGLKLLVYVQLVAKREYQHSLAVEEPLAPRTLTPRPVRPLHPALAVLARFFPLAAILPAVPPHLYVCALILMLL